MSAAISNNDARYVRIVASWAHLPLSIRPAEPLSEDEFFDFCQANSDLRIERTATGEIIVMAPTGGETGRRNFNLAAMFGGWVLKDGTGVGFDSSTGFLLPNGAERAPDAAWVRRDRWEALTVVQREKFVPLCPDFAIELRSPSDRLADQQAKMEEYKSCGLRLGWLLDPKTRTAYIYRAGVDVEVMSGDGRLSGEDVLPGFTLELARIWSP
jgi:Uma2 family endonuclease